MPFGKKTLWLVIEVATVLLVAGGLGAQATTNPFDIVRQPEKEELAVVPLTGNPFDIIARAGSTRPLPRVEAVAPPSATVEEKLTTAASRNDFRQFLFFLLVDGFVLFAMLYLLVGSWLGKAWQGVRNPQLLQLLYREWNGRVRWPARVWYAFFVFAVSVLLFQIALWWQWLPAGRSPWLLWGYLLAAVAGWLLWRHLLLALVGAIFQSESLRFYNFAIVTFNGLLGVLLLPLAAVWAYGPEAWRSGLLWLSVGLWAGAYMYRTMSVLLQRGAQALRSPFLFLLYICAVESAPALVAAKLILSNYY